MISGKDGSILWTLQSGFMQMSSSYSIATSMKHHDFFLFKVQGRDSKFKKTKEGLQKPDSKVSLFILNLSVSKKKSNICDC